MKSLRSNASQELNTFMNDTQLITHYDRIKNWLIKEEIEERLLFLSDDCYYRGDFIFIIEPEKINKKT